MVRCYTFGGGDGGRFERGKMPPPPAEPVPAAAAAITGRCFKLFDEIGGGGERRPPRITGDGVPRRRADSTGERGDRGDLRRNGGSGGERGRRRKSDDTDDNGGGGERPRDRIAFKLSGGERGERRRIAGDGGGERRRSFDGSGGGDCWRRRIGDIGGVFRLIRDPAAAEAPPVAGDRLRLDRFRLYR